MSSHAPFAARPAKPQVTRLPDGRIGVFMGSAYQFTDDDGARSLRAQLDDVLVPMSKPDQQTAHELYQQADRQFTALLQRELESVECGGIAPPVFVTPKARA